ncbi:MAG TPA: RsfS/YbeB/iojap family protein, partial [Myxococcaceae bacterium]|nr:RsfS/YbeB/iojap family protein [Myxococcaceae bacterium]
MRPPKSKTKRPRTAAPRAAPRKRPPRPPRRPPPPAAGTARAETPEALAIARRAAQLLVDRKASDVVLLDVRGMSSYADYFVIASGDS